MHEDLGSHTPNCLDRLLNGCRQTSGEEKGGGNTRASGVSQGTVDVDRPPGALGLDEPDGLIQLVQRRDSQVEDLHVPVRQSEKRPGLRRLHSEIQDRAYSKTVQSSAAAQGEAIPRRPSSAHPIAKVAVKKPA